MPETTETAPKTTWTKEDLERFCADFRKRAGEVFTKDGYHIPMVFLFATKDPTNGSNKANIIPVIPDNKFDEDDKEFFSKAVAKVGRALGAVGLLFISEVWMVSAKPDEDLKKHSGRLHKHPDRVEKLMVSCEHVRSGCSMWTATIKRDADNKPTLEEWQTYEGGSYTGRFTHLLATDA